MTNWAKQSVYSVIRGFGYSVIPNWQLEKFPQSRYLRRIFDYLSIDCVFDVGANIGQYGRFLRYEVGYEGLIVSFEPVPTCVDALRHLARSDGNWLVEPYALGKEVGQTKFNVMRSSHFSSFLPPDHSRVGMFKEKNLIAEERFVDVKVLDDVAPEVISRTGKSSLYLKMDTQGYDLDVVAGGKLTLERFRGLQSEASVTPIYQGMPDFTTSIRVLQERGFELSALFPNNAESHFPRMIEFDCHMIRSDLVPAEKR